MTSMCGSCEDEGNNRHRMTHGWNMKSVEIAAADGHLRCLKAAINAGADVNNVNKENRYTPLMWAAKYGQYECIEALIEAGADVNKTVSGDSPLWYTSFYTEDTRCVELRLDAGADVNYMNVCGTVLMKAAWSGHKDTVDVLIKTGADVNIVNTADGDGFTALTMCAKSPDGWKCIDSLVKAGADVNAVCGGEFFSGGTSALMWAIYCEEPNEKALEELVKAGADVNMADENGTTALHASVNKEDRSFEILMNAGADVNIQNKDGCTPLAILNRYSTKRAETLVEAGAEIPQDILFSIGFCNSANFIRLCLHHGIKINQKNEMGNNALEHYFTGSTVPNEEACMLLHAAGENLRKDVVIQQCNNDCNLTQIPHPEFLTYQDVKLRLKHICRMKIREHLLNLDPHTHLFYRVPRLGLPDVVTDYLLFNMSIKRN